MFTNISEVLAASIIRAINCNMPVDSHVHTRHENLKSHSFLRVSYHDAATDSDPTRVTNTNHVGFEVLTAASVKMAVFRVVAPCSLLDVYRRFRGACCLHHQGSKDLWNIGKLLPDYSALQPRKQPSYYWPCFIVPYSNLNMSIYIYISSKKFK
jgi:hypothetical protein